MRSNNSSNSTTGVGLGSLVFLVFLVLKLTHVITWSWWWVTAPLWGSFAICAVVLVGTFGVLLVKEKPLWGGLFWSALAVAALAILSCVKGG